MVFEHNPSAQYAVTMRLENPHQPGWIAKITSTIAAQGGEIGAIDIVHISKGVSVRDYSVECSSTEHSRRIVEAVKALDGVKMHSISDNTFLMHLGGKLEVASKVPLKTRADLSMAYTPGVARVCKAIHVEPEMSFNLTIRKNMIAVVSDGSAVLGLGNIGAAAAMPVMEGKAILFKEFGDVDAFPLCVETQDTAAIIEFCRQIAPTFGGINLEDITAPKCFEIEDALKDSVDIPVFHDDQHGTAIVVLAGLINALKVVSKDKARMKVVVAGAGAAGVACTKIMVGFGFGNIVVCDSRGAIDRKRDFEGNAAKQWLAGNTNPDNESGALKEVIVGADVFVGVSAPDVIDRGDVLKMAKDPIVFAMSNPDPEVRPEEAHDIVAVMATGRSDYPNQVNNVLAFPGVFRGALDVRARDVNEEMKLAAALAIAGVIDEDHVSSDYVIPSAFNPEVCARVSRAVANAAQETGLSRRTPKVSRVFD